ncbi:hypothetical protein SD427_14510 [Chryseobacterium sp. JJR-5R]|uniref:hypothetical protein n=1 Tax=Chryseobacterium sp. JJR-5R TaxID=3093923 RepID=UPI002A759166|nr:hypothetical protein [Chryseobacterium sp. JJR-5R]WPO81970.1 hypothetical protein SD427_14510 [Chryseobacterium sp. JJR-5R]
MSLGGSWTTWTQETFQIFTGGVNETDPDTMKKVLPGDKIETNDMFATIFSFYGRNTKLDHKNFMDAFIQFGLDVEGIGNPFGNSSKKSTDTIVPLSVPLDGKDRMINVKIPKASEKATYYDPRNGSFYNQNFNPNMIEKRDSIMKSKK